MAPWPGRTAYAGPMKRFAIVLAVLVAVGAVLWRVMGGGSGLIAAALPDFPDYPLPVATLDADHEGVSYFESATPFDLDVIFDGMQHALPTTGIGTLVMPDGASPEQPVPAMVILHGSGGIRATRETAFADWLAERGIAGFVVDYYAPRGFDDEQDYMMRVLSVTEFDAIADAYGALRLLATHPAIDADRIGVMGFSYGGMAARFAMDERVRRVLAPDRRGFATFVDIYGPCFQDIGTRETNGGALLTLRGTEDASNDLAACAEREAELVAIGVDVEAHVYEGAGHAWESDQPRVLHDEAPYVAGCTVVYDERGHSSVDGKPVVDAPPGTLRPERIAMRLASGTAMSACVKSGYLIGRDDETRAKAEARIDDFLRRTLL